MGSNQWSYSGNPNESAKDQIRFLVGDTDESDPLLLDGEINYLLSQYPQPQGVFNAAIRACETIMAKFSRMVDESVGGVKISFSQRMKAMNLTKTMLIQRIATETIKPYCGGISISDMQQVAQNADRPCPPMTLHEMENHQIGPAAPQGWLWGDQPMWGGGCGC